MGDNFFKVSEKVQNHLKLLSGSIKLTETTEDPLEILAGGWLEKDEIFHNIIDENEMKGAESFSALETRGGLIMTYSGSLISLGPLDKDGREVEYTSIGFRTDVPDFLEQSNAVLLDDVKEDEPVRFKNGPIEKSSPVYRIALVKESLGKEEANELLTQITQQLTEEFVEINKTLISE
ncbi:MAG: hypothetical protein RBT69_10855 [Spirochaetia bacterium]|jgi:hypothetical protein|nr:hypothetical protein [Spirochaetia bacterium]